MKGAKTGKKRLARIEMENQEWQQQKRDRHY